MDDKTREKLLNRLRCYLLDVADHATEYGCIGTVLLNHIAGKAMTAVDEATAPEWTPVTPETMPPCEPGVILLYPREYPAPGWDWIDASAARESMYNIHPSFWTRLPAFPRLPPAPLDA